jgi:hypothetical protein
MIECDGVKYAMQGYPGAPVVPLTTFVDCRKFFRISDLNDDAFKGNAGANPAEQVYFVIFCSAAVTADDAPVTTFHVDITYDAIFSEPKEIASS